LRYRARNFPQTLNAAEQAQWQAHCAGRLCDGERRGLLGLRTFAERIAALETQADERGRALLAQLRAYAADIAPDCGQA
jgi:exodeoxyribonuclease-1